jgi:hypothetical protein
MKKQSARVELYNTIPNQLSSWTNFYVGPSFSWGSDRSHHGQSDDSPTSNIIVDNAPGSHMGELWFNEIKEHLDKSLVLLFGGSIELHSQRSPTFIPTASSLDIELDKLYTNLTQNSGNNLASITPFSAVYAYSGTNNHSHADISYDQYINLKKELDSNRSKYVSERVLPIITNFLLADDDPQLLAQWQDTQSSLPQALVSTNPEDYTEDQYACHAYLIKTDSNTYNLAFTTQKGAVEIRIEPQQRTREVQKNTAGTEDSRSTKNTHSLCPCMVVVFWYGVD